MTYRCSTTTNILPTAFFKRLNYQFYNRFNLRKWIDLSLYLVTNRSCVKDENLFIYKVLRAVKGGVSCIQIREQNEDWNKTIATVVKLKELLKPFKVPVIINNQVDLAMLAGADGVHLGQNDAPSSYARAMLGPNAVIGLTVNTWEDVVNAQNLDIDYIGVQLFPSKRTKPENQKVWGLSGLQEILEFSRHRIVGIGGIDISNLTSVIQELDLNRDGIAMVGDLWRSKDPLKKALEIRKIYQEHQARLLEV